MKKIVNTLVFMFLAQIAYCQLSMQCDTTKFRCRDIFNDIQLYNTIYSEYGGQNKQWAYVLRDAFPLDQDGIIHFSYIIKCDTTFDISEIKAICVKWYSIAFTMDNAITINTDNMLSGTGTYYNIAQTTIPAIFYYKIIKLNASTDIALRFKDNRIKMDITCRHYKYISGDSFAQSKSELVIPKNAYPFSPENSNADREVYSQAYINCCCHSLAHALSFLDFINKNFNMVAKENDW
ncbi:MAG: hypothetical protein MJZ65_05155 [Paludibacteraceae bacterium]|nr:hypothetical protein [Paludibacteraceae bacterium]